VDRVAEDVDGLWTDLQEGADTIVLGWGSTWASITAGVRRVRAHDVAVSQAHLTQLNPFPTALGDLLRSYKNVLIPEMNLGQLHKLIRAEYLVDAVSYTQVNGLPFKAAHMEKRIMEVMNK
jgi:2-oxoglutarate ferredoxin oxidoreductase subunit alpha